MTDAVDNADDGSVHRRRPRPRPRPAPTPGPVPGGVSQAAASSAEAPEAPRTGVQPASEPQPAAVAAEAVGPRPWWRRRLTGTGGGGKKSLFREIPVLVVIALVLALLIKSFVVQPFYIPSGSMERTLLVNDRVLVNKMIYHFRDVKRGEIVVFNIEGTGFARYATPLNPPSNIVSRAFRNLENLFGLGPNNKDFIKRVIAVGGDTVACCNAKNQVTVNGVGLVEPYVFLDGPEVSPARKFGPIKVAKGNLWVMGDHRNDSADSRVGGQVPQSKVVGQAFVRVWPLSKWRGFGVPQTFSSLNAAGSESIGMLVPIFFWRRKRRKDPETGKKLPRFPVLDGYRAPPAD
ncbi:MAG: signal peptidase [Mycobacterium sp.]|nr:signal peptidase [Mycobacterium sp.]